jgi:hypothetical protein
MRHRRLLPIIGIILVAAGTVAALGVEVDDKTEPAWLREMGLWFKPHSIRVATVLIALGAVGQILPLFLGGPAFRAKVIQRTLDVLVNECDGRAKHNRITVFKRVPGWRAKYGGLLRLRWRWWSKENRYRVRALLALDVHAEYLVVWARSSEARRPRSTTCWRVSDLAQNCMGVAGKVWEEGVWFVPDLPQLREQHRADIQRAISLDELLQGRGPNDAIRRYLDKTGAVELDQLKAVEVFGRHFYGQTIQTEDGLWGVLLLDSEADACPFPIPNPPLQDRTAFEKIFRTQALTLGNMLQGA